MVAPWGRTSSTLKSFFKIEGVKNPSLFYPVKNQGYLKSSYIKNVNQIF